MITFTAITIRNLHYIKTNPMMFIASAHSVQFSSFFQIANGDAKKRAHIQMRGTRERISRMPGGASCGQTINWKIYISTFYWKNENETELKLSIFNKHGSPCCNTF
jgi:hypothetical protein